MRPRLSTGSLGKRPVENQASHPATPLPQLSVSTRGQGRNGPVRIAPRGRRARPARKAAPLAHVPRGRALVRTRARRRAPRLAPRTVRCRRRLLRVPQHGPQLDLLDPHRDRDPRRRLVHPRVAGRALRRHDAPRDRGRRRDQQVREGHLAPDDHRHDRRPSVARADRRLRRDRPADRVRGGDDQDPFPARRGRLQEDAARRAARVRDRARGGRAPAAPAPVAAAAAAPAPTVRPRTSTPSLTRLADMRDRGLITQAEFDEKKRELLDRL